MAITFPASPNDGDVFTNATTGVKYIYNATDGVWKTHVWPTNTDYLQLSGGTLTGDLSLGTNDLTAQDITTTGSVTVGNGLTVSDGNIVMSNGHGIDFSATADGSGTVESELLDDYEEGTFSPFSAADVAAHSITIPNQAHYVKIGRKVQIWMRVRFSGTTASQISGNMPFPCSNPTSNGSFSPFFLSVFPDNGLSTNMAFAYLGTNGTTNFGCYKNNDNYSPASWNSGPTEITITGSYRTT